MSKPPIIDLEGVDLTLSSSAGPVRILRRLSVAVGRAETVAVVGPSGSGKSSMMMVVAGLERASAGRVVVAGRNLGDLSEDELSRFRRDSVGIVFQDFHLIPTMTALENVAIPLELAGRADAFARAADCLAAVGLEHRVGHYPAQLSGGEQQRTALARAFVAEPDLLLADEPTGNLDAETSQQVIELLFDLRRKHGSTLVLITHEAALAARCDRTVHLVDGGIVDAGAGPMAASGARAAP